MQRVTIGFSSCRDACSSRFALPTTQLSGCGPPCCLEAHQLVPEASREGEPDADSSSESDSGACSPALGRLWYRLTQAGTLLQTRRLSGPQACSPAESSSSSDEEHDFPAQPVTRRVREPEDADAGLAAVASLGGSQMP